MYTSQCLCSTGGSLSSLGGRADGICLFEGSLSSLGGRADGRILRGGGRILRKGRLPTLVVAPTDHMCGGVAPRVCIYTSSLTAMLASMQSRGGAYMYRCFVCLDYEDDYAIEAMGVSMV